MLNETISWWRTNFGASEIKKIAESIKAEHVSQGKIALKFEKEFARLIKTKYAVSVSSGTAAIYMTLFAMGIKRGDEVIIPDKTWIATAHPIYMLNAKTVAVDVKKDLPIIDEKIIEQKITKKTKAIIPVHLNGRSCEMNKINRIAKKHKLIVIEDAAQAAMSRRDGKYLGTFSKAGCFSFSISKLISTGQGGMIVTNDLKLYKSLKLIRNNGVVTNVGEAWKRPGLNFKFTDVLASIGLVQIKKRNKAIKKCKNIYQFYKKELENLKKISLIPVDVKKGEIPLWVEVLCKERSNLINFLSKKNVQVRPFNPTMQSTKYLKITNTLKNSKKFAREGLTLPCGPAQSMNNIRYVVKLLKEYDEI